jgi:tetratricopeptide (TPR) repeat protein
MKDNLEAPGISTASSGRKRWIIGLGTIGVLAALGLGVWLWPRLARPQPPVIDLTQVDSEIAEAITEARQAVERKPSSGPAWGHLGMVLRAHDYALESVYCLAQAERLDRRDARWPYLQGLTLLLTDPEAGLPHLKRAVELCGETPLAPRLRLAEVMVEMGRLDEAEQQVHEALAQEPDNTRAHFVQGQIAVAHNDAKRALAEFNQCVADEHARRKALRLRAQVYRRLGDRTHAEADDRAVAELSEDVLWPDPFTEEVLQLQCGLNARVARADVMSRNGQLQPAIALLEETTQKYPTASSPWLHLADLWRQLGRSEQAEQACRQAVQVDPDEAQAWFGLGCFQASNRPREAAESFRKTLRLKPDHALAHFNLAYCLRQLGDSAAAAEEYRQALRCRPDYGPARNGLKELEGTVSERTNPAAAK